MSNQRADAQTSGDKTASQTERQIELAAQQNGASGFQSARIDRLATDVRREADSTQRLADTTDKQLVAIKATSDSTKAEADALKSQLAVQQAMLSNTYAPLIEITPVGVEDILIKNGMFSTGVIYSIKNIGNRSANNISVWISFAGNGGGDVASLCKAADAMGGFEPPLKIGGFSKVADHPQPISVKDIAGKIPRVRHSDSESYMTINPMVVGCVSYISPTDRVKRHITFSWIMGPSRFPSHVFDTLDDGVIPRNEVTIGVRAYAEIEATMTQPPRTTLMLVRESASHRPPPRACGVCAIIPQNSVKRLGRPPIVTSLCRRYENSGLTPAADRLPYSETASPVAQARWAATQPGHNNPLLIGRHYRKQAVTALLTTRSAGARGRAIP